MSAREPQAGTSDIAMVTVSEWLVCHNSGDDVIVLSCTVSTADGSSKITSAGLILNDAKGNTLAASYTAFSDSITAFPSINLPPGSLSVGDTVNAVVQGECDQHHYFFEEELTITNC